ncbi:hypothetical protein BH18ACT10_BH18ACT10_15660 [soil metagenome]
MDNVSQLSPTRAVPQDVTESSEQVETLTRVCSEDLISAFGLGNIRVGRAALERISHQPARWLAKQIATYDEIVGQAGLGAGGTWAMQRMARRVEVVGAASVPRVGSVLIVSNHPGLADAVEIF